MQLMSDAISGLGSRHHLIMDPIHRRCYINRSGVYPGIECELVAGVEIDGRVVTLPLCQDGTDFDFLDQDMTPCTFKLTGIDEKTTLKLELTITSPFRPRDERFSTRPILDIRLLLTRLDSNFRGYQAAPVSQPGRLFLELRSQAFTGFQANSDQLTWQFDSPRPLHRDHIDQCREPIGQQDLFVVHNGQIAGQRIELPYTPDNYIGREIHLSWCTHSPAMMTVRNADAPFKYTQQFDSLAATAQWARNHPDDLTDNAVKVDRIIAANNLDPAINRLMALTLHSWLLNTWWTLCEGKDWFNVWEGNCYYLSTMDVEYTQSPFYLSVWPELLALELERWPEFTLSGEEILGPPGKETLLFMHDIGWLTEIDRSRYSHPMPIEQNCNYVLMNYGYWRRTGDFQLAQRHKDVIVRALDFIVLSDSTGDGVPDQGTANTIDDACPALQFGKKQVYLAVKAAAALETGADILDQAGDAERAAAYRAQAARALNSLQTRGWNGDHFNMLLRPDEGMNDDQQNGGWDATHIYTSHGLVLLDMTGRQIGIDPDKLVSDLQMGLRRCLDKYGCRHSDYLAHQDEMTIGEFGTFSCPRVGWIAMNIFRDLAALYRQVDARSMPGRYWEFQTLVNTQGPCLFFETFNGNRLMTYPRGVASWGYFDALAGMKIDQVRGKISCNPLTKEVKVPILLLADWTSGTVPVTSDGELKDL